MSKSFIPFNICPQHIVIIIPLAMLPNFLQSFIIRLIRSRSAYDVSNVKSGQKYKHFILSTMDFNIDKLVQFGKIRSSFTLAMKMIPQKIIQNIMLLQI